MAKKVQFWIGASPLILSLILTLIITIFFKSLPAKLPLFYSAPWGEKQLATHTEFLILPASIIAITLLNFTITSQLHPSQSYFKKMLLIASCLISLILTLTFIKIVLNFV